MSKLKKVFAYLLSWSFFWMGDLVCKIMEFTDQWWLYPVYNKLMGKSSTIQDWAGNETPWSPYIQPNDFRCLFWKKEV